MSVVSKPFASVLPHGAIQEALPSLHWVMGTVAMPGRLPVRFSRNMTIVKDGERLVLVNSVRLDDAGLAALDKLGKVTDIVRLAANHGMDDPFYKDRYKAKVWAVRGQRYTSGFDVNAEDVYFEADEPIDADTKLPIEGARAYVFKSTPPEAMLVLERHGGTVIAGDSLQHWHAPDAYFSFVAKLMMRVMGFIKPHNVGPGWFKHCKPPKDELRGVLDIDFANLLPAHGDPVIGKARDLYKPAIERVTS